MQDLSLYLMLLGVTRKKCIWELIGLDTENCERYFVAAFTSELYLPEGDINSLVLLKDVVHYFVHVLYNLVTCMCRCPFKNPFIDSLKDIVIVYI